MNSFGETIRRLRQQKNLPLRTVAAFLDIDQAILSKIERGQRKATREIVISLASYFGANTNELLISWLSDNILYQLRDEQSAVEALQAAKNKVLYRQKKGKDRNSIIQLIQNYLKRDGRVTKAWLFGSFARGENRPESDIDLMIRYSEKVSGTLLEYADIKNNLENLLHCNIDLVEEGYVSPFAFETINRDKILIYG